MKVSSPRLKKILSFRALRRLRTNKFNFYFRKVSSPWLKKILNFIALKRLRTNKFNFYFLTQLSLNSETTNQRANAYLYLKNIYKE